MKKSSKYTINTDVFESKSRPVSVASVHESFTQEGENNNKQTRFDSIHKPVLFLKSCPSPGLWLKKTATSNENSNVSIDPESLAGLLSAVAAGFDNDEGDRGQKINPAADVFNNSDVEIHCNPVFKDYTVQNQDKISGKQKKKKRKMFKFRNTKYDDEEDD